MDIDGEPIAVQRIELVGEGTDTEGVGDYFHPKPFVLLPRELFTGLAFAFGIGLGIGGLIAAILFHL